MDRQILKRLEENFGIQVIYLNKRFNMIKHLQWTFYNVGDPNLELKLIAALNSSGLDGVKLAIGYFDSRTNCIPITIIKP